MGQNNIEEMRQVYNWLCDDESRDIYMKRLSFLVSGEYHYMSDVISSYVQDLAVLNEKAIPELLESIPNNRKFYLYGAGMDARINLHYVSGDPRFAGFCDRNSEKQSGGGGRLAGISSGKAA